MGRTAAATRRRSPRHQPRADEDDAGTPPVRHRNDVVLLGRVAQQPTQSELPSGDPVVTLRLVVERGPRERRPPHVDTVDCSVWSATARRRVLGWVAGDVVEIEGRLRRRFWRSSSGPVSRYEVEVVRARRVSGSSRERSRPAARATTSG
jgi:single-strand DNA-binding protein